MFPYAILIASMSTSAMPRQPSGSLDVDFLLAARKVPVRSTSAWGIDVREQTAIGAEHRCDRAKTFIGIAEL